MRTRETEASHGNQDHNVEAKVYEEANCFAPAFVS